MVARAADEALAVRRSRGRNLETGLSDAVTVPASPVRAGGTRAADQRAAFGVDGIAKESLTDRKSVV